MYVQILDIIGFNTFYMPNYVLQFGIVLLFMNLLGYSKRTRAFPGGDCVTMIRQQRPCHVGAYCKSNSSRYFIKSVMISLRTCLLYCYEI